MGPKVASCTLEELVEELTPTPAEEWAGRGSTPGSTPTRTKKAE